MFMLTMFIVIIIGFLGFKMWINIIREEVFKDKFLGYVKSSDYDNTKRLLETGKINIRWTTPNHSTALYIACSKLDLEMIEILIPYSKSIINFCGYDGKTPLLKTSFLDVDFEKKYEILKILIKNKANPNIYFKHAKTSYYDDKGKSLLELAVTYEDYELVNFLINEGGVNPAHKISGGPSASSEAYVWGYKEIYFLLLKYGAFDWRTVDYKYTLEHEKKYGW